MIKNILCFLAVFSALCLDAQNGTTPQMADTFRQEGKIYIVITVIAIVFLSIIGLLVYLERRISRLEQEIKKD